MAQLTPEREGEGGMEGLVEGLGMNACLFRPWDTPESLSPSSGQSLSPSSSERTSPSSPPTNPSPPHPPPFLPRQCMTLRGRCCSASPPSPPTPPSLLLLPPQGRAGGGGRMP